MITAKEAREIAMEMAQDQAWYAPINAGRMGIKRQYYQVNDYVCFEYWNKHEWEFTLGMEADDGRRESYYAVICTMSAYMNTIDVTLTKIPALLAKCKARFTYIDNAFSVHHRG